MPIHDWTRVRANRFHDFHQSWTIAIRNALNAGLLPSGYFALVEQKTGGRGSDVVTPDLTEAASYARKANRITICRPDAEVAAVLEMVSPGNKDNRHSLRAFTAKALEFLQSGVHLLVVDLFPARRRDPQGIHKVIWDRLREEPFTLPPDKPLTAASYAAGTETVAYVEQMAVGDCMPEMPVFLTADQYVPCPLEETYMTAWQQIPAALRASLELPPAP